MSNTDQMMDAARSHLGYVEGPRSNQTPFGAWAGTNFQPWCMAYVSFILNQAGAGIGRIAFCPTGVTHFRNKGQLFASPQRGDVFFLFFPSKNRYAHTGFVDKVDGDWIITCEGNSNAAGSRTGGSVCSNRRRWAGTRTVFGRPALGGSTIQQQPDPGSFAGRPLLKLGSGGSNDPGNIGHVKHLQERLLAHGNTPPGFKADGDFGSITERVVEGFQRAKHLVVDGEVGLNTWKALG